MPEEIYGRNYDLKLTDDTRMHYIRNDFQLTHINCASEFHDGYLVSALIQGLIGFFDVNGKYNEITRGFVGCHGVRPVHDEEFFYFSDSTTGTLIEMDLQGNIKRRFYIESKWLHDALYIKKNYYLLVPSDKNTMELWNIESEEKIWEVKCDILGATTQFISNISEDNLNTSDNRNIEEERKNISLIQDEEKKRKESINNIFLRLFKEKKSKI